MQGRKIKSVKARVLTDKDLHARNTFAQPDAVKPVDESVTAGSPLSYSFKPASVTALALEFE